MISGISIPFAIISVQNHKTIKEKLLEHIDNYLCSPIISHDHRIFKSDWNATNEQNNLYKSDFLKDIQPEIEYFVKLINFQKYTVHDIWFQQYQSGDSHFWHNHSGCHYTCIYYLEIDPSGPFTQFVNPMDQSVFQVEVIEGDLLFIPGMIKHQSPITTDSQRKTIISFNLSLIYDNDVLKI